MERLISNTIGFITGVAIVYLILYILKQKDKTVVDITKKYDHSKTLPLEKRIVRRFFVFKRLKGKLVILKWYHILEQYRLIKKLDKGKEYSIRVWKPVRFININDLPEEDRKTDFYNRKQYWKDYLKWKNLQPEYIQELIPTSRERMIEGIVENINDLDNTENQAD